MPRIRQIHIDAKGVTLIGRAGSRTFAYTDIPATATSKARVETWVNDWLAQHVVDHAAVCHVFSLVPPHLTLWLGDVGTPPPPNWWVG